MLIPYPITKTVNQEDEYFGTKVSDPYRWLEDDNSPETKQWVCDQNEVTFDYLRSIENRDVIKDRLSEIWNYQKFSSPKKVNQFYYYWKNDGLQNQSILYRTTNKGDDDTLVLDPNTLSPDGTSSVGTISFSRDGKYLAYTVSEGGSDWKTIRVMDLHSMNDLKEMLTWVKFTEIAWYRNGFFYSKYPEPSKEELLTGKNQFQGLYYHRINTNQESDINIFVDSQNPDRYVRAQTTEDERFLVKYRLKSTSGEAVSVTDLQSLNSDSNFDSLEFSDVIENFEYDFNLLGNVGDDLYFQTNYKASKSKIIKLNNHRLDIKYARDIIGEKNTVLMNASLSGHMLVCNYSLDVKSKLQTYTLEGDLIGEIELDSIGMVNELQGRSEDQELFFKFGALTHPPVIYRYNLETNNTSIWKKPQVALNTDSFQTKQIFYSSKDGTKIPMYIVSKKGLNLNGQNPCWLYGYGGFDISINPSFSPSKIAFVEQGGIFCIANIRGGGEYGKDWHKAGTKLNKQNVFDDFIAGAEYLIDQKYTNSTKLIIEGASNGGLLVGACMTQRPDLFAVCLPQVGVLDMLRYHKFTVGWGWAGDYGTSEDSKEMFEYLLSYSPLHNCATQKYPATLITTADHDDRVVPAHSFKFAATLQQAQIGAKPILIRIDTRAGHGAGKSTKQAIEEATDIVSFALDNIG